MGRGNPFLLVALLAVGCGGGGGGAAFPGRGRHVHAVLPSLDGGELDLATLRGQVVVLHFFTTWSLAAQVDVGELKRVREAMPAGSTAVVGVGLDPDGPRLIAPWRRAVGADWPITLPTPELADGEAGLGRIEVVPTTVVLDAEGRIVWRHAGGLPRGELDRVVRNVERHGRPP